MKRIFLLLLIVIYINTAFSQSNYKEGYIIEESGDTLEGYINDKRDVINNYKCYFKKELESKVTEYFPSDIQGFRFVDGKVYISKYIKEDFLPKKIFLEYLVKGYMSLYYSFDGYKGHYYAQMEGEEVKELIIEKYEIYIDGQPYNKTDRKYIPTLLMMTKDNRELQAEINSARFNHEDLLNITKKYNEYKCVDCVVYSKKNFKPIISFSFLIGYSYSKVFTDKTKVLIGNNEAITGIPGSHSFPVGAYLSLSLPQNLNWSLNFGVLLNHNKYYWAETDYEFFYHTYDLEQPIILRYTSPFNNTMPTFFVGITNRFCRTSNSYIKTTSYQGSYSLTRTRYLLIDNKFSYSTASFTTGIGSQFRLKQNKFIFFDLKYDFYPNTFVDYGKEHRISIYTGITF